MCDAKTLFYWGACPVCKCKESLRMCGRCKLIYYCSREHQKTHWPMHKSVCESIHQMLVTSKLRSVFTNAHKSSSLNEWNSIRTKATLFTNLVLGRKLTSFERQMFMFPRVCEVCKVDDHKILKDCNQCMCVSYCSALHQEEDIHHKDVCSSLEMCKLLDLSIDDTSYVTFLTTLSTFYFKGCDRPENMKDILAYFPFCEENENFQRQHILCSELLSCPFTLLHFLDQVSKISPSKDSLTIHIVGASDLECGFPSVWDIVLQWFPQNPRFQITFVGPEIKNTENNFGTCDKHSLKEQNVQLEFCNSFYHDYMLSEKYSRPDVIAAFNCGFQEYEGSSNDTWGKSLPYFFKYPNAHIILTSYTKAEAEKDLDILISLNDNKSKIILHCVDNPFSSCRPHRDWDQFRSNVFFVNKYVSVVQVIL